LTKKYDVLIIDNQVGSLAREELKIRPGGGEKQVHHYLGNKGKLFKEK